MAITFLKFTMLAMVMHTLLTPFETGIEIIAGYTMILATIGYAAGSFHARKVNVRVLYIIWIFVYSCSCGLLGAVPDRFGFFESTVMISCFLCCFLKKPGKVDKSETRFVYNCGLAMAIIFCIYTYLPFPFRYTIANDYGYRQFTLSMGNPNAVAIQVLFVYMVLLTEFCTTDRPVRKKVAVVVMLLLSRTLIQLASRTAIASLTFFVLLLVIRKRGKKLGMLLFWMTLCLAVCSIGFHIIAANIGDITIFGKSLSTGRNVMFEEILRDIGAHPMWYLLGRPDLHAYHNYHNGPLSIFCNVGIVGFLMYFSIWGYGIKNVFRCARENPDAYLSAAALLAFLLCSCSEAAPLIGNVPYAIDVLVFLHLGLKKRDEVPVQTK